jgi:hypothetical protein
MLSGPIEEEEEAQCEMNFISTILDGKQIMFTFQASTTMWMRSVLFWEIESIRCTQMSVRNYHYRLYNNSEQFRSHITIKAIPLQAWTSPEGSRSLRLPDFKTIGT